MSAPPAVKPSGLASVGRHAIVYAIGNLLGKAVSFLMLPVYTRYLTTADYGVAALVDMTLDVVSIVAGQQIASGVFRFYHKTDNPDEQRAVVSTAMGAMGTSYIALGTATFLGAGALSRLIFKSDVHADIIRLAALNLVAQCLYIVPLAYARIRDKSTMVVGASMAKLVLQVAFNILFLVVMHQGVRGIFMSTLFANLAVGLWMSSWAIKEVGIGISRPVLKMLVRYGAPLMGMQAATFTMTFADRYFLQAAASESAVGIYNLAYQFGFLMLIMGFAPVEMVWGPRRFRVAREPNANYMLAKAFRLINVVVLTVGVSIALFVGDVLHIMTTPPFFPAAALVPFILIAYVFHGWAMMQDLGILLREKTEVSFVVNWAAALVALASFALLIPRYHAWGAVAATILAFIVRWSLTYLAAQKLHRIEYDWGPVRRLVLVAAVVCTTSLLIPVRNLVASVALHVALYAVYFGLVWTVAILTPDEKLMVKGYARTARLALAARLGARAA